MFGGHTFVSVTWACWNQTAVSRSGTEYEVISLDTLRMEGLLALKLLDVVIDVGELPGSRAGSDFSRQLKNPDTKTHAGFQQQGNTKHDTHHISQLHFSQSRSIKLQ